MDQQIKNVLLVEDDPDIANKFSMYLKSLKDIKFKLNRVACLREGLERVKRGDVDIILLDLGLPESEGIATFEKMHTHAPVIPIVIITELEDEDLAVQAIKEGAQDYLIKNHVNSNMLSRVLKYSIERHRLQTKSEQYALKSKENESRIRQIIEQNVDSMIIVDSDGIIQFVNPAAEKLLNKKAQELVGDIFGFPVVTGESTELNIVSGGKEIYYAEMRVGEMQWKGKSAYLASLRDITTRKKAEQELLKTKEELDRALQTLKTNQNKILEMEKLKSVQELAGGVAHLFSQPLQALSNYIGLIENTGDIKRYIDKCKKNINRISELNTDMRNITSLKKMDYVDTQIMDLKASAAIKKAKAQDHRVLVVDDEKEILETLVEMFRMQGFVCNGASDGAEGLKLIEQNDYCLIISDVMMPNMSGPEFFKKVKARGNQSFFIFLTGYEIPLADKAIIKQADAVLAKPVSFDHFFKKLEKISGVNSGGK